MEAYIAVSRSTPPTPDADLSRVASVASFFICRVDTEVDRRLEAIGHRRGAGVARQGRRSPRASSPTSSSSSHVPRCPLGRAGGPRRPRAAPALGEHGDQEPGLLRHPLRRRVDRARHRQHAARRHDRGVRGPRHAGAARVDADVDEAERTWAALADVGVDMDDVADRLEREGVDSFKKSFDELLTALETKADELRRAREVGSRRLSPIESLRWSSPFGDMVR